MVAALRACIRGVVVVLALTGCGGSTGAHERHIATGAGSGASGQAQAGMGIVGNAGGTNAGGASGAIGVGGGGAMAMASGGTTAAGGAIAADGTMDAGGSSASAGSDASGGNMASGGSMSPDDDGPAVGTLEDSGADCPIPTLAPVGSLPAFEKHPDPFTMLDGTRITQKAQWRCRRAEIKAQLEQYESGPKPVVAAEDVSAQLSGSSLAITVSSGGKSVHFSITINRPSGAGTGAIPLLIAYFGETLDGSVFSQNGVATTVYDNDALGAESGGASRGTGVFYDLYGRDNPASSIVAWAWGVSRIIDAIEKTPDAHIDPRRIAVTGCSRYGKGALLAGALDERIVLTIPQESGAGGSASWRVSQAQSQMGENVQTLSSAASEQPWFRADFGQSFGGNNVTKLPFDHHMVMGLVAPRALLVIDNHIDWLGIDSTFTAGSIAHTIWDALGIPDHMGYWQSSAHTHCQFPSQQRAILDAYVKKFLVGTGTDDTAVMQADSANADLGNWMPWTAPSLE